MSRHAFRYAILLIPLLCSVCFVKEVSASRKLYVLTAVDTQDEKIGKHSKSDVVAVRTMFSSNVANSQLVLLDQITDAQVTRQGILGAIGKINPSPEDAVLLYYSGHGAHFQDDQHYWVTQGGNEKIPRSSVLNALKQRGFGLVVLISDCCFNFSESTPPRQGYLFQKEQTQTAPLFKSLFFDLNGLIDVNSAKKGQVSGTYPDNGKGSIFSAAFCSTLIDNKTNGSLTWDAVLTRIDTKARADFQKFYPEGYEVNTPTGLVNQRDQKLVRLALNIRPLSESNDNSSNNGGNGIPDNNNSNNNGNNGGNNSGNNGPVAKRARATNARFGVTVEDQEEAGVQILAVTRGGPATRCTDGSGQSFSLERGDSVTAVNGVDVFDVRQFSEAVRRSPATMRFRVTGKDGDVRDFSSRLIATGGTDDLTPNEPPEVKPNPGNQGTRFGAYVAAKGGAVRVTGLVPDSPAERCRDRKGEVWHLEKGDIITRVNGRAVSDDASYRQAINDSPRVMTLQVLGSDGKTYFFTATLNY